jgi:ABC-type antimicrobial peptide transport system permease subunit
MGQTVFMVIGIALAALIGGSLLTALVVLIIQLLPITKVPLGYNWRNITVRWVTTLMVTAGFALVIFILVVNLAFVEGLNALSKKTGPEGNVIILRDGANDELFSDIAMDDKVSELWNQPEVVCEGDKPLASQEVYSIATQELPPENPGDRPTYRFLQVRGVEDPETAGKVHGLRLKDGGRWLSRLGTEVVMGEGIARQLNLNVGSEFELPPMPDKLKVVGILDSRGSPFDSEIWAKREEVGRYYGKDNAERKQSFFTSIVVRTPDAATAQAFARDLQNRTQVRISAMPERKYYEEMSKSNEMFRGFAIFVAGVMAVGGMLGLMTTMFAAVSQRIKDIGVLRVMGFGRWQVLQSLLVESLLFALLGGAIGVGLGYMVNGLEQVSLLSSGQGGGKTVVFTMIVNHTVLLTALAFVLVMGVLGGLLPALSAMRLKVLDAVR